MKKTSKEKDSPEITGHMLLVDDNEQVLTMLGRMISSLKYTPLLANNGSQALQLFHKYQDKIICVILDHNMPEMNGDECFQKIRAISTDVPVVFTSGGSQQDALEHFQNDKTVEFIRKPYRRNELKEKLHEFLFTE